jgi:lipopolysaccharide/colanic/teichoic acid biosynthesis glycosyltransferase
VFSSEYADPSERQTLLGVPVIGRSEAAVSYEFPYLVCDALIAVGDGWQDERSHHLAKKIARRYPHLQLFSAMPGHGHCLARARPLGPYLIIQTSHSRFTWSKRAMKRLVDIAASLIVLVIAFPFVLAAGLAIKASDGGPMLFGQEREGRGGRPIRIYKLRSMVVGAEAKLAAFLANNSAARFEYERTMKLRDDPRIIPVVGKLVRKTSLDEIPQLWSVLKGDMSLVGPRVMPTREVSLYSKSGQELRRDVAPGLTGFWQVEHRSDSDFSVREIADSFYVANWSIWLDLWIILRTVRVVLTGSGAF